MSKDECGKGFILECSKSGYASIKIGTFLEVPFKITKSDDVLDRQLRCLRSLQEGDKVKIVFPERIKNIYTTTAQISGKDIIRIVDNKIKEVMSSKKSCAIMEVCEHLTDVKAELLELENEGDKVKVEGKLL